MELGDTLIILGGRRIDKVDSVMYIHCKNYNRINHKTFRMELTRQIYLNKIGS